MELNDYFKTLAEEHVDILHSDADDNKGYFRSYASATILLDNEFHKNLRWVKQNCLISQFNDDGQIPVPSDDFPRQQPNGTLYILSRIIDGNAESARLKAIEIRNDIYARLSFDSRNGLIEKNFQVSAIQSTSIGRVADNFYGLAVFINYNNKFSVPYNVAKWQSIS
jgi:hypothetical protein